MKENQEEDDRPSVAAATAAASASAEAGRAVMLAVAAAASVAAATGEASKAASQAAEAARLAAISAGKAADAAAAAAAAARIDEPESGDGWAMVGIYVVILCATAAVSLMDDPMVHIASRFSNSAHAQLFRTYNRAQVLEMVAIIATLLLALVYAAGTMLSSSLKQRAPWLKVGMGAALASSVILLIVAFVTIHGNPVLHLICVWSVALLFLFVDVLACHAADTERNHGRRFRDEAKGNILFVDLPTVLAFTFFLFFLGVRSASAEPSTNDLAVTITDLCAKLLAPLEYVCCSTDAVQQVTPVLTKELGKHLLAGLVGMQWFISGCTLATVSGARAWEASKQRRRKNSPASG